MSIVIDLMRVIIPVDKTGSLFKEQSRPRGRQGFSGESDSPTTKCHSMNEVSTSEDDGETSAFRLAISQKRCYRGSRGKHSM
ncbi:hypothetical protein HZH66_008798 [Vespula vulgaris]|uniref:Uncharacterized protein n=1 Tax=Vespula vulgaris TaxID=7454 RepID=A0A834JRU2_VESVU|nr:hypothetical protein HZH66_008798 [Vespula vulgaris]